MFEFYGWNGVLNKGVIGLFLVLLAGFAFAANPDQSVVVNTSSNFYWQVLNQTDNSPISTAVCVLDIYNSTGQALFLDYPNAYDSGSGLYSALANNSFQVDTYNCALNCSAGSEFAWNTFSLGVTQTAININITGLITGGGGSVGGVSNEIAIFLVVLGLAVYMYRAMFISRRVVPQ